MRFLPKDNVAGLLGELSKQAVVWAPLEQVSSERTVTFSHWSEDADIVYDRFTALSAKELVLPASEKLISFRYSRGEEGEKLELEEAAPEAADVLFGARACDARALAVLDALFDLPAGKAYNDPYYKKRRQGLTVITLACTECDAACFCSSWEEGTAATTGSDIILYPARDGFLAEPVTARGQELAAMDIFEESEVQMPELAITAKVELPGLKDKLPGIFADEALWEEVSAKCVSCGYCTYTCPTCYCFNVFDEMRSDREGDRCRSWDACMFYLYTLETSGHNPRPAIAHRYRNRMGHKFSYYPENQGEILCTGCGRCIRGCPVGLDIRDVIRAAAER